MGQSTGRFLARALLGLVQRLSIPLHECHMGSLGLGQLGSCRLGSITQTANNSTDTGEQRSYSRYYPDF